MSIIEPFHPGEKHSFRHTPTTTGKTKQGGGYGSHLRVPPVY